jgi:hypothetical protein
MYIDHVTHIERREGAAIIPLDPINADYAAYLAWLGEGNTPGAPPPVFEVVPAIVTMRQARLELLAAGKLNAVGAAIASLPADQKEVAQIEWDYSATVERGSELVALLGAALGFDAVELDALFTAAAKR